MIISSEELRKINKAIEEETEEIEVYLELGLEKRTVKLAKNGFYINNKLIKLEKIKNKDNSCYLINDKLEKVQYFNDNLLYKLLPTKKPILQISGTSMHKRAFVERIEKERLRGKILDSGTGLGYSAIAASKSAEVITIEFDKNVIEMAKLNPYSKELFNNKNIKLIDGDLTEEIKNFKNEEFNNLIFDAGTPRSSGEFFSLKNYKEAHRVLKRNGRLYHYIPRHHIQRGRNFIGEIIKRIEKAGFTLIERNDRGSYVIVKK